MRTNCRSLVSHVPFSETSWSWSRKFSAIGLLSVCVFCTVPSVATITVAESGSWATTPVQRTLPVLTDLFCSRISIRPSVDLAYWSRKSPVAPAITASILACASS